MTSPLANQIFDNIQAKLIKNLENFGTDDVTGLMALIPQNFRQATAGIAKSIADPLDKAADKFQARFNEKLQSRLPQVQEDEQQ